MTPEAYAVILVHATSHALRAEKLLQKAAIRCKLIPVPRHISSSCGVCVRIAQPDREAAMQALLQACLEIESVHDI
jgi:ribosomal protein S11